MMIRFAGLSLLVTSIVWSILCMVKLMSVLVPIILFYVSVGLLVTASALEATTDES